MLIEAPAIIFITCFDYGNFPEIFRILSLSSLIIWPYIFSCILVYIYEKPNKTKIIKEFLKPTINKIIFFLIFLILFWAIPYGSIKFFGFCNPIIAYLLSCLIVSNTKRNVAVAVIILLSIYFFIPGYLSVIFKPDVGIGVKDELEVREFIYKCEGYCADNSSLKYCTDYFGKDIPVAGADWDGNGEDNELIQIGRKAQWEVCEDRLYCFHFVPCERFGENSIEGCAEQLCLAGNLMYENITLASRFVFDIKPGSCDLPDNNWHSLYFPENVCEIYVNETE
ncbi:MAG: hypothetical protein DRP06_02360 [Candidatus Aenigmatarchaeota archaeon]|nr:MAG: hypothetical protein DRP06_02360 [Candidatus Aenigmarchaeota archaeon]